MTFPASSGADEAYAVGLLQQITAMCDETRRALPNDPGRISTMLDAFEETLATLAPMLDRIGRSPTVSRDAVLAAAQHASTAHQSLIDAMSLELERLGRAIAENGNAASATNAYNAAQRVGTQHIFDMLG